ncbi:MAG: dihydropteroate synthase [Blastocatellia bacterium]|nr:dihydropteroate synthase [Blastocatellia bacterium]
MKWSTSKRVFDIGKPLVMGILNVTPDSFSDGGDYASVDAAVKRAEEMVGESVDIIDVGGESTRPGSVRISEGEEIDRVVPVIEAVVARVDVPISIDTSKASVARAAVAAGAEIINDISGLRWDADIATVAAETGAGLVLMHSRGRFETMHSEPAVDDIVGEVSRDLRRAVEDAAAHGVKASQIALDIGIGFGKTAEQNLELLAKLDKLVDEFAGYTMVVGTSRKSFMGKIMGGVSAGDRLSGSLATMAIAVWNGVKIVRVHDVRETVDAVRTVTAIREQI